MRRCLSAGSMGALSRPIRGQSSIGPKRQQPFVSKAARYDGDASASEKLMAAGENLAEARPGRRAVLQGVAGAAWLLSGECAATAETAVAGKLKRVADPVLAYEFLYPVETASGKKLNMSFSRRPEKYSSAAPLTSDARQRIVCELIDLVNSVTVSVSVGPAPARLVSQPAGSWRAKAVADSVLVDKSTARITTGQRVSLSMVEASGIDVRDGGRYYVYEHVAQGSPTVASNAAETYRHALAVTAVRSGMNGTPYLFTLNLACPDKAWSDLAPLFEQAVSSFRLVTPGRDYIPPDKDPWLFF